VKMATQTLTKSFVAEIIGPAGSGKTSLTQLLLTRDVRAGLSVWRLPLALLAVSSISSFPNLVKAWRHQKGLRWDDLKLIIQYHALLRLIAKETAHGHTALLLDEGSVFALAKLQAFGPRLQGIDPGWMDSLIIKLAPALNAVIWLDAPDSVLAQRIRQRDKSHRMKDKSDAEISKHLSQYRGAFENVVAQLASRNGLKILKYSTAEMPLDEIANRVMAEARAGV
jgi:broad-specificity NMP kinase